MELWLARHAETEWSKTHRHTGRTDVPLTDEGRRHAATLADRIGGHPFARVLVSPLSRARETAEIAGYGDVLEVRDDLVEFDYGEYEGITTATIRETRPDWFLWRDGSPGGETPDQVGARVDRVIAEALQADGDVLIVAHGHVLRALGARWLEQPAAFGGRLALDTGALCRLGFERETRVIWAWNS
jgi:broad specificity phosphatase PhoE